MKNNATPEKSDATQLDTEKHTPKRPPIKPELTITLLFKVGKFGVNQPEAYDVYGESCLHTSISTLQNTHGITVFRKKERWQHRNGGYTHFNRYWLPDDVAKNKALNLLNLLRKKRDLPSIELRELSLHRFEV